MFRPYPLLVDELADIDDDLAYPSLPPDVVPPDYLARSGGGTATLIDAHCAVTDKESLAAPDYPLTMIVDAIIGCAGQVHADGSVPAPRRSQQGPPCHGYHDRSPGHH